MSGPPGAAPAFRARRAAGLLILLLIVIGPGATGCRSRSTDAGPDPPLRSSDSPAVGVGPAQTTGPTPKPSGARVGRGPRGLTAKQRQVDRGDPDQVAVAFVVRLEAWDTALDRRPNDAVSRAVGYAGPKLRSQLLAGEPVAAPGQRWNELQRHRGWTSVRTRLGGLGSAPTTDRTAVRAVSCSVIDHGNAVDQETGGWISFPDVDKTYVVRLRKPHDRAGWTVVGYTIQ